MPKKIGKRIQAATGLRFIGENERPMRPEEVAALRPILATKEPPKEYVELTTRASVYVTTASERDQPKIAIEKIGRQKEHTLWRLSLTQREELRLSPLLGRTATRESPEFFLKGMDRDAEFRSYRPGWADVLYTPRLLADTRPTIRRINGRFLKPSCVFGSDNRQVFKDSSWPWRCIGRIFNSDGFTGSGALVAHNMVVTAGHMVPATAWLGAPWWMKFVPAYFDGASLLGKGVQSFVSDAKGWAVSGSPTGYDWAILKLYTPLGDSLGWFGYNGYSDDWEDEPFWTLVGYAGAVAGAERPSFQSGISVFDDDSDSHGGRELEHQGDSTDGDSGGPFFSWWNGDPRLIGVQSGCEEDYIFPFGSELGNVAAGGSGFTSLISWGRSNW